MSAPVLLALLTPWILTVLALPLVLFVRGTRLRDIAPVPADDSPLVSIIVPARNEALNISPCVASLTNSIYPRREIVVVDDGSTDGTGDIVRILADHADGAIRLIEGEPLPAGWLGKPWACWQGYRRARGELLLFTDADTRHDDTLLGHAVGALVARGADLVSVMPRQRFVTFWERLVLPQIFTILFMRYPDMHRVSRTRNPNHVIANGQFILIRRDAYEAVGGHEALKAEVVEDQRLAQRVVAAGRRIFLGRAEDLIETRMYRSLGHLVEGWSKNLAQGSRQSVPGWAAPMVPWFSAALLTALWVLPPLLAVAGLLTGLAAALQPWALLATALGLVFWLPMYLSLRVPPLYALGYPLAAAVVAALFVRSALRGSRVVWKGRAYDLSAPAGSRQQP